MSEISDMIQRLCPDGVEYRKLGEVVKIMNGKDYKSHQEGIIPVYGTGGILTYIDTAFDDGPTVLLPRKGSIDKVYYVDSPFWTVDTIYWTKFSRDSLVCPKFLYYFMTTINLSKMNTGTGAIPSLTQTVLSRIEIPVPPLEVQRKIVEVLDNFSELTAELEAELEARKKQYEYYRDNLLNFSQIAPPNTVKWMKLGEICSPIDNIKWKMTSRSYQYIDLSSVDIQTHRIISTLEINCDSAPSRAQQIVRSNDVIFATTRPTQMRACLVPEEYDEHICSTGYCVLRADLSVLLPQFLFYSLTTDSFKEYLSNNLTMGNYPSISNSLLKEYLIPIPPLAEQERIVSILDRFEALTTDLTAGLPAEIKARQQQYEYYRDQLLTFKRAN